MHLWGGLECTLNRVGPQYFSQCEKSGHHFRLQDLEIFSQLGIKKIRYPCLWEMVCPEEGHFDWSWLDERLGEFQRLGLDPIAGLLHHGSGPRFTHLLDPAFPAKFSEYALAFAKRYPWVKDYIPIDEILTTARFSALYGHWYPHRRDDVSFIRALFHQVKASILAMNAIRSVQPDAIYIQAEDVGRAQSTETLAYQRDFENQRRWLGFDLLCGKVDAAHPLYGYLQASGLTDAEMAWLQEHALPPDIFGINHYLLSNRFLDHRLELYPPHCHGRNYFHFYADVGSVDTDEAVFIPPKDIIRDVWERYHRPLAVTEVHVRGHREAQMRWLNQVWKEARELENEGIDLRAVTVWSLLGSYDWNSLCCYNEGFYEPGVFDLRTRDGSPKTTALGNMVRDLARQGECTHPVLASSGWWEHRTHLLYSLRSEPPARPWARQRPLLIAGAGSLGQAFARICEMREISYRLLKRTDLDIAEPEAVHQVLKEIDPWAVINTAGYVKVDRAEQEPSRCFRENVVGAANLALWCADHHIPLVQYSSDFVFNGLNPGHYLESDPVEPLNIYGKSKAEGESKVLEIHPEALVIRTASFFGPWDGANFATQTLRRLLQNKPVETASDLHSSPTYIPDLVNASLDLMMDGEKGIIHLANASKVSWTEFAELLLRLSKSRAADRSLIIGKSYEELKFPARRPCNSALASEKLKLLPDLEHAIFRYFCEIDPPFH